MRRPAECKSPKDARPRGAAALRARFADLLRRILALEATPHAIAGGVAIGMFVGFTPLFGLKTLLSLGIACVLGCNPVAAVLAVTLHDVVTPFWPAILWAEFHLGAWLLGMPPAPEAATDHFAWHDLTIWSTHAFERVVLPTLVGSSVFSVPAAVVSYLLTRALIRRRAAPPT